MTDNPNTAALVERINALCNMAGTPVATLIDCKNAIEALQAERDELRALVAELNVAGSLMLLKVQTVDPELAAMVPARTKAAAEVLRMALIWEADATSGETDYHLAKSVRAYKEAAGD